MKMHPTAEVARLLHVITEERPDHLPTWLWELAKEAEESLETCKATIRHGPGHQSRSECQAYKGDNAHDHLPNGEVVHRCNLGYGEWTWTGMDGITDFGDSSDAWDAYEDMLKHG
jgi:hypothetical protein